MRARVYREFRFRVYNPTNAHTHRKRATLMKQLPALVLTVLTVPAYLSMPAPAAGQSAPPPPAQQPAKPQPTPAPTPAPAAEGQATPAREEARKEPAAKGAEPPQTPDKQTAAGLLVKEIGRARFYYRRASYSARVLTEASDPLFPFVHYQHIARQALREAWRLTGRDLDDETKTRRAERTERDLSFSTHALRTELRSGILAVAQRREPALVKEFLDQIEEKTEDAAATHNTPILFGTGSLRRQQLANAALSLAAIDPAHSVELAADTLGFGMPQELQLIFQELAASSPAHARELFRRAVPVFAADQSVNVYDAVFLSAHLKFSAEPEPDETLVRRFLDAALGRMLRLRERHLASGGGDEGERSAMLMSLNHLQPFFQSYHPGRLSELSVLAHQLRPELPAGQFEADAGNLTSSDNPNSPETLVSRAASEKNQNRRDTLYLQAALKFAAEKKFDRALDAALAAREGSQREPFLTHVRFQQAQHLAATGELNESAKVIERIPDPELRAEATVVLTSAAVKKKDTIIARYALDQTSKSLGNNVGSVPHARASLWLASAYASFDTLTGFELMGAAVRFANAAPQLQDLRPERRILRLGESVREAVVVGGGGAGDFRAGFRTLARADFPRTVQVAESFTNQLFRGLAVVAASARVLQERPKAVKSAPPPDALKPVPEN